MFPKTPVIENALSCPGLDTSPWEGYVFYFLVLPHTGPSSALMGHPVDICSLGPMMTCSQDRTVITAQTAWIPKQGSENTVSFRPAHLPLQKTPWSAVILYIAFRTGHTPLHALGTR